MGGKGKEVEEGKEKRGKKINDGGKEKFQDERVREKKIKKKKEEGEDRKKEKKQKKHEQGTGVYLIYYLYATSFMSFNPLTPLLLTPAFPDVFRRLLKSKL